MKRYILPLLLTLSTLSLSSQTKVWQSESIAVSGDNIILGNNNTKEIVKLDESGKTVASLSFDDPVTGLVVYGNDAYVTTSYAKGALHKVNLDTFTLGGSLVLDMGSKSPTVDKDGKFIYVCNQFKGTVSKVDLASMKEVASGKAVREPFASVLSADGKYLFVNNFLPLAPAQLDYVASELSVFDTQSMQLVKNITLDNGSNALRGIALSPDGRYVLISHNLGRFQVPTSQLQQGWMNTSALSVVDASSLEFVATTLLDEPERGAAGIWGVQTAGDKIVVSHSGTHDISVIPYTDFAIKLEGYEQKTNLSYDLYFIYGLRERIPIVGNGPRNFVIKDDKAYIPTFFSDTLNVYNLESGDNKVIAYNPDRVETPQNIGERNFNDAMLCFQNWQSCNGCHPGQGRTDGLNWDLMNDGIGNPKNCKSMLLAHVTGPAMITGIRESAEVAVRKGFTHIQFANVDEQAQVYVDDYLKALKPLPSPYLVNGELSELAKKGKTVFDKLNCAMCHSGEYYTDLKMHRIGENVEFEKGWDTPTLIEVWRTAPYLFDGRAVTMQDVFKKYRHGIMGEVSDSDLDALSEYVLSL